MKERQAPRPRMRKAAAPEPCKRTASLDALMEQSQCIVFGVNPERESQRIIKRQHNFWLYG